MHIRAGIPCSCYVGMGECFYDGICFPHAHDFATLQLFSICCFSSESEEEAPPPKKEYHFKNKKEAIEAFKTLLKEKVQSLFCLAVIVVGAQLNPLGVTQYV